MTFEIEVTAEFDGVSAKGYLKKHIDLPYFRIPKLLKEKRITLNGKKIKQGDTIKTGDIVKVWLADVKPREIENKEYDSYIDMKIPVVFETEDFLVLNKLPGIVVQGARERECSLPYHLSYLMHKNNDKGFQYFHAHRIDRDTSGVLVVGKTRPAVRDLNEVFRSRSIVKKYVCLVSGILDEKEGKVEVFLNRNPQGSREKVAVCNQSERDAKRSLSFYKVIEEFDSRGEEFSLVEVEIKTGITHQIRVHMKHIGHPIVGDRMYGNTIVNSDFHGLVDRQFLHAKSLESDYNKKHYKVEADFTEDLKKTLDHLRKK